MSGDIANEGAQLLRAFRERKIESALHAEKVVDDHGLLEPFCAELELVAEHNLSFQRVRRRRGDQDLFAHRVRLDAPRQVDMASDDAIFRALLRADIADHTFSGI